MHKCIFFKLLVLAFGVLFIVIGLYKICVEHISSASLAIISGVVLLLFTDIDKIESFSLPGLQAKLKSTLVEAEELVFKLRRTSVLQTEMLFTIMARLGGGRPLTRKEQYEYVQRISEQLRSLKVNEDEIDGAKKDYYYMVSIQMAFSIVSQIQQLLQSKAHQLNLVWQSRTVLIGPPNIYKTQEVYEQEFREEEFYYSNKSSEVIGCFYGLPSSNPYEKIIDFINGLDRMTEDERLNVFSTVEEELKDLNYIITRHEFRRPEIWFNQ